MAKCDTSHSKGRAPESSMVLKKIGAIFPPIQTPPSRYIHFLQVKSGFDVADNEIVKRIIVGDLVITSDIPLAYEVLCGGGHAINPRGEPYTQDNIKDRLNMRDFMDALRSSGIDIGGPAALSSRDVQAFANQLDKFLVNQR